MERIKAIDLFAGYDRFSSGFEQVSRYSGIDHMKLELALSSTLVNRLKQKWGYKDADSSVLRYEI